MRSLTRVRSAMVESPNLRARYPPAERSALPSKESQVRPITLLAIFGVSLSLTQPAAYEIRFEDVTKSSRIEFQHVFGSIEKTRITDVNGSGAAFLDFDRDGDLDIYIVNGSRDGKAPGNALYRNESNGRFTDVTSSAGVAEGRWGLGVAAADYDNDGFP